MSRHNLTQEPPPDFDYVPLTELDELVDPADFESQMIAKDLALKLLLTLPPRDERLLRLSFGIGTTPRTLTEIADEFSIVSVRPATSCAVGAGR